MSDAVPPTPDPSSDPSSASSEPGAPAAHEFRNRTYLVADVAPLDVDGVRTVEVGTALFFLGFLALLPFYGRLQDADQGWWLWTCLTGTGLGLLGLEYVRRRRAR